MIASGKTARQRPLSPALMKKVLSDGGITKLGSDKMLGIAFILWAIQLQLLMIYLLLSKIERHLNPDKKKAPN